MWQTTIETTRQRVEWSFEPPSGFVVVRRAVPPLGYPWEVAGAGDWNIVPNCPPQGTTDFDAQPRLDLMPAAGVFVWLLMGDFRLDNSVDRRVASPTFPFPYQYVLPKGLAPVNGSGASSRVSPIVDKDAWQNRPGGFSWIRLALLTNPDGTTEAEPLYLMIKVYVGSGRSSISDANSLISSLAYRYAS